ncbi:diguanylate cyclase [Sinorhizobium terangae]|uniref:diguanylate cyclase n=1 Tax=Sinorhizobium terangae TaxID=110322 RepID=UPI0024B2264B|nr:diguanylate cyclase [Sinorhizobium terangae]WFU49444.1 diguanylate cyclase [Sinorhizobium terangae]
MNGTMHFLNSLGVMALLAIFYGSLLRRRMTDALRKAVMGVLFGGAAAIAVLQPIHIGSGVLVDARNLIIGCACAFFGPLGASATLVTAAIVRVQAGGVGIPAGLASMMIAYLMGAAWEQSVRSRLNSTLVSFLALGAMISLSLLGIVLLPADVRMKLLSEIGLFSIGFNLLGAVVLGSFIERERRHAARESRLSNEAKTDPLTGLLNRRSFQERYERQVQERNRTGSALLVVDLDHFKDVNDANGHDVGDIVLQSVGRLLNETVRQGDVVARIGGEEFVVFLPNTELGNARLLAERIRQKVQGAGVEVDGRQITITTSVGGHWHHGIVDLAVALKQADIALYRAKEGGRNRVEFGPAV